MTLSLRKHSHPGEDERGGLKVPAVPHKRGVGGLSRVRFGFLVECSQILSRA